MSKTTNKYSPEVRERAVRMALDNAGQHESKHAAKTAVASVITRLAPPAHAWRYAQKLVTPDQAAA